MCGYEERERRTAVRGRGKRQITGNYSPKFHTSKGTGRPTPEISRKGVASDTYATKMKVLQKIFDQESSEAKLAYHTISAPSLGKKFGTASIYRSLAVTTLKMIPPN